VRVQPVTGEKILEIRLSFSNEHRMIIKSGKIARRL
jgi:hypothetical protein